MAGCIEFDSKSPEQSTQAGGFANQAGHRPDLLAAAGWNRGKLQPGSFGGSGRDLHDWAWICTACRVVREGSGRAMMWPNRKQGGSASIRAGAAYMEWADGRKAWRKADGAARSRGRG